MNTFFVCLTTYDVTIKNVNVAFKPQSLENTLGEYLSSKGKSQLRAAETEKYAQLHSSLMVEQKKQMMAKIDYQFHLQRLQLMTYNQR